MKILPFDYTIPTQPKFFWSLRGAFYRYQPDFLIAVFNQVLFFLVLLLTYFIARRLFDSSVALLSTLILLGTELLWRFSVSGLSTMLVLLFFMALIWCLTLLEGETREPRWGAAGPFLFSALAGLLVGLGCLTRYSFGWLLFPVLGFILFVNDRWRRVLAVVAFAAFAVVVTPWVIRNYSVSGTPLGTAGYTVLQSSYLFPENSLQRSLEPDVTHLAPSLFWQKFLPNARRIFQNDLPKLGGTWLTAFFLVGLMINFRSPALRRLRLFLVACLGTFILVQALGRTQLSDDSPELNSENLLVLMAPMLIVYGVSLFYLLLDQIELPFKELRYAVMGGFTLLACLPMVFTFLPPKPIAWAYPPYNPPFIQLAAGWVRENELTMSDMPWAMAWYGQRQSVWLTLNQSDFFTISDYQKPIQELHCSRLTMDSRFLSQWLLTGDQTWSSFVLNCAVSHLKGQPGPLAKFPLRYWQPGWPETFLLTAREKPVSGPALQQ